MAASIKRFTIYLLAGANLASILITLFVGYAGHLNPTNWPWLTNAGLVYPALLAINLAFLILWLLFNPRWSLLSIAGFIVCYEPTRAYSPLNLPATPPDDALKILSYNVCSYYDDGQQDGESPTIRYSADAHADIVCLQEAVTGGSKQAQIDSLLYSQYPYHDTIGSNATGVIALLSRYPIKHKERIDYVSAGNISGAFTLDINGEDVVVVNNHLETTGLTLEDRHHFKVMVKGDMERDSMRIESKRIIDKLGEASQLRAPQARAVASFLRKHAYQPLICVGDFNDSPLSYTHHTIARELTDCFITTGNGPGISYHHSGFYVRIDHILCSSAWTPYHCYVDREIKSSDHYPIICWLKKQAKP